MAILSPGQSRKAETTQEMVHIFSADKHGILTAEQACDEVRREAV